MEDEAAVSITKADLRRELVRGLDDLRAAAPNLDVAMEVDEFVREVSAESVRALALGSFRAAFAGFVRLKALLAERARCESEGRCATCAPADRLACDRVTGRKGREVAKC